MRKWIIIIAAVLAAAAFAVPAALAAENGGDDNGSSGRLVFCLNGVTVEEGDNVLAAMNWLPGFDESQFDPVALDEGVAEVFRFFIKRDGGVGKFRLFLDEEAVTDLNFITEGPCGAPGAEFSDRAFWLCYSKSQKDPAVYDRATAMSLFEAGYWVPFAVQAPVSDTNIGNGVYLTCNLPAGYTVKSGVAVSTGGGEIYTGPADLVSYMLTQMPLDYTVLAAKP